MDEDLFKEFKRSFKVLRSDCNPLCTHHFHDAVKLPSVAARFSSHRKFQSSSFVVESSALLMEVQIFAFMEMRPRHCLSMAVF